MKIGGVPEHYNAPIHRGLAKVEGWEFQSFPSGTGAMLEALEKADIDLAVLLTEGVSKHALFTGKTRIIGTYVDNPLPWGVHVSPTGRIQSMNDLNANLASLRFGISRMGSGSHLMANVHASVCKSEVPEFKIVDTMKGARDAMERGEIDVFLWDITTADVYAREGVWKCIGTVSGDWPAFVFACRSDTYSAKLGEIENFVSELEKQCVVMKTDADGQSVPYLMDKYRISESQAVEFMKTISWNSRLVVSKAAIERVINALQQSSILPSDRQYSPSQAVMENVCELA